MHNDVEFIVMVMTCPNLVNRFLTFSNCYKLTFHFWYILQGRQVVTYLLICNLIMWIIYTFEIEKVQDSPVQVKNNQYAAYNLLFDSQNTEHFI